MENTTSTINPSTFPRNDSIHIRKTEIEELDKAIGKISRCINSSNYELMVVIREFDERAGWLKWSFTDCCSWLMWRCDLSYTAARDKLRIAHALKDLPQMSDESPAEFCLIPKFVRSLG